MSLKKDIFSVRLPQPQPKCGNILIAEPFLAEPYFERAVISVIQNQEDATAMGIVLNKSTYLTFQDVITDIQREEPIPLFCGGPLSTDRLFYIHTLGELINESTELSPGLYFGGNFKEIKMYIESGAQIEGRIRFFLGYSGWDRNQLQEELENHVWVVASMFRDVNEYITGEESDYWRKVVSDLGDDYRQWLLYPDYPELN